MHSDLVKDSKVALSAGFMTLVLTVSGCSQSSDAWKKVPAGTSHGAMGYVVDGATVAEMAKIEKAGGTIREIYAQKGVYEVLGVERQVVEKVVPASKVFKNKFFPAQFIPRRRLQPMYPDCHDFLDSEPKVRLLSEPAELALVPDRKVIITKSNKVVRFYPESLNALNPIEYKMSVTEAPETSVYNSKNRLSGHYGSVNKPLELVPDDMGAYEVIFIAKLSEQKICSINVNFGVTDNAPYKGRGNPLTMPLEEQLRRFPHLASIGAANAWKDSDGAGVLIALVDTGVNYNHPALQNNVYSNSKEIPNNGVDDDQNNLIDDVNGWDFLNQDSMPYDDSAHGSHIMGMAASVAGVAPKSQVLIVKTSGVFGGDLGTSIAGLHYAIDMGAKVINFSLGASLPNPLLKKVIDYAESKGVLVVTASGNSNQDIDDQPVFPASLDNENIMTVAATDLAGNLTSYTNYGEISVDVAAPGGTSDEGLVSANYANSKDKLWLSTKGTSFAAPLVSGAAALILSKNPNLTPNEVKTQILLKGTLRLDYTGKVGSSRFLDLSNLFVKQSLP